MGLEENQLLNFFPEHQNYSYELISHYGEMKLDWLNFPLFIPNPSPRLEGEVKQVLSLVKMDSACPRGNLRHIQSNKSRVPEAGHGEHKKICVGKYVSIFKNVFILSEFHMYAYKVLWSYLPVILYLALNPFLFLQLYYL